MMSCYCRVLYILTNTLRLTALVIISEVIHGSLTSIALSQTVGDFVFVGEPLTLEKLTRKYCYYEKIE